MLADAVAAVSLPPPPQAARAVDKNAARCCLCRVGRVCRVCRVGWVLSEFTPEILVVCVARKRPPAGKS